jgi:hypothetical protein
MSEMLTTNPKPKIWYSRHSISCATGISVGRIDFLTFLHFDKSHPEMCWFHFKSEGNNKKNLLPQLTFRKGHENLVMHNVYKGQNLVAIWT